MNIQRALRRGFEFGTSMGLVAGIGAMLVGAGTLFAPALFGVAATANPGIMMAALEIFSTSIALGGIAAAAFGVTHTVTHAIPGLAEALGEPRPRHRPRQVSIGRNRTVQVDPDIAEEMEREHSNEDNHKSFTRKLEEQRQFDEQQDLILR